jgi:hypothetical protein
MAVTRATDSIRKYTYGNASTECGLTAVFEAPDRRLVRARLR